MRCAIVRDECERCQRKTCWRVGVLCAWLPSKTVISYRCQLGLKTKVNSVCMQCLQGVMVLGSYVLSLLADDNAVTECVSGLRGSWCMLHCKVKVMSKVKELRLVGTAKSC